MIVCANARISQYLGVSIGAIEFRQKGRVLRPDLISTQGPKLFEAEFGAASRIDFGGAHAGRIVGRA